jgi:PAS domain S-box-containing protein
MRPAAAWRKVDWLGAAFRTPGVKNPVQTLSARALYGFLIAMALSGVFLLSVHLPFFAVRKIASAITGGVILTSVLASLVISRRGHIRLAGWVLLSTAWLITTILVVLSGGIHSPGVLGFLTIIVAAAWILGRAVATVGAGVFFAMTLAMALIESSGRSLPQYFPSPPMSTWLVLTFFSAIAIFPTVEVLRILDEASEQRFRNLADAAPVLIWVSGLDKLCTFFNKPWLDFTGRKMEEELGNGWAAGVHPDDLERCLATYSAAFDARRNFQMEYRLRRADGEYRWVLDNGAPSYREAEFTGFIGSCVDVTEQKQIEERLRANEILLKDAQRLAKVGSWMRDLATGTSTWSDETLEIFGLPKETHPDFRAFLDCVHPEDREELIQAEYQVRSKYTSLEIEYRIVRPNGEVRFVRTVAEAIRNERSVPVRIAGATQDITEQVRTRELFRRSQEQDFDRQKLESVGMLTAGIAHDFNNLLGAILVSADLALAEHAEGAPVDEEALLRIRTAAIRGGEIVRQLMMYGGKQRHSFEPVDISRLAGDMLELMRATISKRARLEVDLPENVPAVQADAPQIRQVLMNLIGNASEALGERDGVISVRVAKVRLSGDAGAWDLAEGDYIRLEVGDTGHGMTEGVRGKIFDPFFTTKFAGRGLGLAVVRGIVRAHGGAIDVASAPAEGSRFAILLPCCKEPAKDVRRIPAPPARDAGRGPLSILIVEDEEALRRGVSRMLRKAGFTVMEAADGKAGVALFQAGAAEIDLVFLDMTLPGMSGGEVLLELRRIQPGVKVLITSAYGQDHVQAIVGEQHSWLFLRKPYRIAELTKLLRGVRLDNGQVLQ